MMKFTTDNIKIKNPIKFMVLLYVDGFKNMSTMSKTLWIIAVLKIAIMFGVLKTFFFKEHLSQFKTKQEKIEHISNNLTTIKRQK